MKPSVENQAGVKKPYAQPDLKAWGTVADLTQTGLTRPGDDAKSGSVLSQGV